MYYGTLCSSVAETLCLRICLFGYICRSRYPYFKLKLIHKKNTYINPNNTVCVMILQGYPHRGEILSEMSYVL